MPFNLKTYVCYFPANKDGIFPFLEMNISILKQAEERHITVPDNNKPNKVIAFTGNWYNYLMPLTDCWLVFRKLHSKA